MTMEGAERAARAPRFALRPQPGGAGRGGVGSNHRDSEGTEKHTEEKRRGPNERTKRRDAENAEDGRGGKERALSPSIRSLP
jgi:hypothetical protein